MEPEFKRLFFGIKVVAPWEEKWPKGRILDVDVRHVTLAFLGNTNYTDLKEKLVDFPKPPFEIGPVGQFDEALFLPPRRPRVACWHVSFAEEQERIQQYQQTVTEWLLEQGFSPAHPERRWLPHVTLARSPFQSKQWKEAFQPLPLMLTEIRLFESLGHLKYGTLWSHQLTPPFEEVSHTGDLAFSVYGRSLQQLFIHAQAALAFEYPPLVEYFSKRQIDHFDTLIQELNHILSDADSEIGVPFKAVTYHSTLEEGPIMKWEMIVDV